MAPTTSPRPRYLAGATQCPTSVTHASGDGRGHARFAAIGVGEYHGSMRWLLHGNLTTAVAGALQRHNHEVRDLASVGLPEGSDALAVLEAAKKEQLDLLTADAVTAAAPFELDFWFNRSIVYLQLEGGDVEQDDAVDRLFERYKRLTPGRLYTVTETRVKVRQLPGKQ